MIRVGHGYDSHRFKDGDFILLGGVKIPSKKSIVAHSDGDILIHAICDALLAPQPGRLTFPINIKNLSGGFVVNDEEVKNTIKFLAEHLKIVSEPGGAVAAAAILHNKIDIKNKNVVVMISGGNIDIDMFLNL